MLVVLAGFNNQWQIGSDSAIHLNIGRNIAAGLGYTHPDGLHETVSPGLAYMTALGFSLFGPGHLLTSHTINIALGGIGLMLSFWLFRLHADRGTAVLMTVLLGTNENYYIYLFRLLADLPFAVGALLSLVGYERIQQKSPRAWLSLLLITVGIMVMAAFRTVAITFIAALVLAMFIDLIRAKRIKSLTILVSTLAVVILLVRLCDPGLPHPLQCNADERVIYDRLTSQLPATLANAWHTNLPRLLNEAAAEAVFAIDFGPIAAVCLSLVSLISLSLMTINRKRSLWLILPGLFILQWLAFLVVDRYFLPLMPLLIYGWWWTAMKLENFLRGRAGRLAVVMMLVTLVAPNLIRIGRLIQVQRSPDFIAAYRHGKYRPIVELAEWMSQSLGVDAKIVSDSEHTHILSYLSGRHVSETWRIQTPLPKIIYLVQPLDARDQRWLTQRHRYTIGPAVATIHAEDTRTYTVHRGELQ